MREIVEKLLEDVDPDIRDLMMGEHVPDPGQMTVSTYGMGPCRRWQLIPDPLFFIIQWQELRNENKNRPRD